MSKYRIYKCQKPNDNCAKFSPHWVIQAPDDKEGEGTIVFGWQAAMDRVEYRILNPDRPIFYI